MLEKNIKLSGKRVFVTGAGGFIGSNLCMELLREYSDIKILGFDSMNDYYMIRQADKGYLVRRADGSLSRSLKGKDLEGCLYV